MIWISGDLHGGESDYHVTGSQFKPENGDICLVCGDFGGVWYHDYHENERSRRQEDGWLDKNLKKRITWLTVDGNHENFARLFSGEFPLVEIFDGMAYKIRENIYYLKRGEIFTIEGKTFLAFGGAFSHDRFGSKTRSLGWGGYDIIPPRIEGENWWPQEIPSQEDFNNAVRNLDRVGWVVDHVITHTFPVSQRPAFYKIPGMRVKDPVEDMLEALYQRLTFKSWHFGHHHINESRDKFYCHYGKVEQIKGE